MKASCSECGKKYERKPNQKTDVCRRCSNIRDRKKYVDSYIKKRGDKYSPEEPDDERAIKSYNRRAHR